MELLAERLGYRTFSSGDIFREFRTQNTHVGRLVRQNYDLGAWLPWWFAVHVHLKAFLEPSSEKGIMCEGSARTLQEAEAYVDVFEWLGWDYLVFLIETSDEESHKRQQSRQRDDLVPHPTNNPYYSLNFVLAFFLVKLHLIPRCLLFRLRTHAAMCCCIF